MAKLTLEDAAAQYFAANQEFGRSLGPSDETTFQDDFGTRCSKSEIDDFEEALGRGPLPPSYRAFLALYGKRPESREGVIDDGAFVGVFDPEDEEVQELLDDAEMMFEDADEDPSAEGILVLASDRRTVWLVQPRRADGEMDVVDYELSREMSRSKSILDFLIFEATKMQELARRKTKKKAPKTGAKVAATKPKRR